MSNVRLAKEGDEKQIFEMLIRGHAENGMFPMDAEKMYSMVIRGCKKENGILIGVIDGPDCFEGTCGLFLDEYWYTSRKNLTELWTYVLPEFRKSDNAKKLIEFQKSLSDKASADFKYPVPVFIGIMTLTDMEQKVRLYQRSMKQIGAFFMHGDVCKPTFVQRFKNGRK